LVNITAQNQRSGAVPPRCITANRPIFVVAGSPSACRTLQATRLASPHPGATASVRRCCGRRRRAGASERTDDEDLIKTTYVLPDDALREVRFSPSPVDEAAAD
jgi:hypothetical protein